MKIKVDRAHWYWCGFPGHLTDTCRYHLTTVLPTGWMVSTVGDLPDNQTVDNAGNTYETMVFKCNGLDKYYPNPDVVSWNNVDTKRYSNSIDAERGHYRMCEKYATIPRDHYKETTE